MVIEMPVLDNGLLGSALAFTPLLVALTFGESVMKLLARVTRAVPRRLLPHYGNVMLDLVRQDPGPSGALLQGLFFGARRAAPQRAARRSRRRRSCSATGATPCTRSPTPACSSEEMPNARLLEADSLVELRLRPERLTDEIAAFLDEVWRPARAAPTPKRRKRACSALPAGTVPVR